MNTYETTTTTTTTTTVAIGPDIAYAKSLRGMIKLATIVSIHCPIKYLLKYADLYNFFSLPFDTPSTHTHTHTHTPMLTRHASTYIYGNPVALDC